MKKRILIPTDYSTNAFNAIKYALELYKEESCEFFIFHSYYLSGFSKDNLLTPEPTDAELERVRIKSERNMSKLKVQMKSFEENPHHSFQYMDVFGSFYDVMEETVKKESIEFVIMGTQGESDKKTVVLGSNAVNVMERIRTCPVMAIPATVAFSKPNEIVFPTSFLTDYKETELDVLREISRLTDAPIRILHVQKDKKLSKTQMKNKALLESILGSVPHTYHTLYDLEIKDGVRSFVQSRESDMIAFINRKHNFFGSIFSNPMVKELGKYSNVPLLAVHDVKK
ncbi:universal stress protein [Aequorivita sp. H23M31]|uniref:Universal stress protein n=1 Tax=Aequorivita ciconiae TaxID=2494375 RepID=A0A410FZR6_9FLAO|nr:universal stress protein [Aequorivita sp. H23M31]QAA80522.1 universal stress protein [Aequorivita sp. H23M31]